MGRMLGLEGARTVAVTAAVLALSGSCLLNLPALAETRIEDLPFAVDQLLDVPDDGAASAGSVSAGSVSAGAVDAAPEETAEEPAADAQPPKAAPSAARQTSPRVRPRAAAGTLEGRLGFDAGALAGTAWSKPDVERFYRLAGGEGPVWTDGGRAAGALRGVLGLLARAGEEGLDPADYPLAAIDKLIADGDFAAADVLVTDAVIRYAADRTGARLATVRLPQDMRELGAPSDAVALAVGAAGAADPVATLAGLGPQGADYAGLRRLLADYRRIAAAGGWPSVEAGGSKIVPSQYDPRIKTIRARLALTDGAAATGPREGDDFYDAQLAAAVERFQARHGLATDAVIGRNTLRELGRSVEYRIRQIIVNLERLRQDLAGGRSDGIVVNLPEFMLRYWENGTNVLTTRVIVGRISRKSPLLASRVSSVVVNPTWTVPSKLAGEDIVRHVLEDPNYIEEHGFTIYSDWSEDAEIIDPATIDWASMPRNKSFPFRLRQRPGADNSLGVVKINFSNKYAVYMHDTPDRRLFAREVRAISSGCVRVMNPLDLVERLLAGTAWPRERVEARIGGELTWILVKRAIPVRFTYVTAWVDAQGVPQFRNDLYGIDQRIADGLGHPVRIAADGDSRPIASVVP